MKGCPNTPEDAHDKLNQTAQQQGSLMEDDQMPPESCAMKASTRPAVDTISQLKLPAGGP